jgi:conflict system STAND superfamily ATPase/trypsin-like peptidase
MQIDEPILDHLNRYTVAIQKAGSDSVLGTGVIVTDDGLILTCYHVAGNIKTKTLDKTVDVYFPAIDNIKRRAEVLEEYSDSSLDIAFLQLQDKELPKQAAVANLSETIDSTHAFQSFGFRKEKTFDGLYSDGIIQGKVRKKFKGDGNNNNNNIILQEVIQLKSDGIDHGMSGAAVLDIQINRVIGIISEYLATSSNVDKKLALAIPIESIIQVYPELKQKNPGLRIFEFLRKIHAEEIEKYHRINDLFVPPTQYEEIQDILAKHRIVFITGTKEYGKTYTAVRLLWEYFNEGYEPKWYSIEQEKIEGRDIRNRMIKIENLLKEHHVILFDDPFGKTQYEGNEELERNIGTINDAVENTEDAYLIITSREEIFKEFVRITEYDPKDLEVKMNLKTSSYDYEKRKEMLLKWAEVYNCKWLSDDGLKAIVLEAIKDKTKLPTSLNIQNFAYATKKTTDDLSSKINEKSQETAWSFANEIKNMTDYKILFLSFPFISDSFSVDFIKAKYQELINELDIKKDSWSFERVLYHFKDDKIDISRDKISFSHPSYSESLSYLLLENGFPTEINTGIFSNVLMKLSNIDEADLEVANFVYYNFDRLPDHLREELLIKLADNEGQGVAGSVARTIANNYDKVPDKLKNLLFNLSHHASLDVAYSIAYNFDKLPDNVRNILFTLADNEKTVIDVAYAVAYNYDKVPDKLKNLLFKLADDKGADIDIAYAVAKNADKLPADVRNLLSKIAIDNGAAEYVYRAVSRNFDKLPQDNVTKELFIKLADNRLTRAYAAKIAAENFSQLPANVMNELLKELVPKFIVYTYLPWYVYKMLLNNFVSLSNDLKELLFEMIDKKYGALLNGKEIIILLMDNFKRYPYNIRNELLLKFENSFGPNHIIEAIPDILNKVSEDVLDALVLRLVNRGLDNHQDLFLTNGDLYDKLSDNAKSELLYRFVNENRFTTGSKKKNIYDKLSDNAKSELLYRFVNENRFTMKFVSYILIDHSDDLPKDLAKELVLRLMNQYDDRLHLALIIIKNHEKLDYSIPIVTNILLNLALHDSYSVSKALLHYFDVMPVELKELLFKFADNKKTAKGLYDILLTTQEEADPFESPFGEISSEISENISDELINELIKRANKSLDFHSDRREGKKQLENN